MIVLVDANVIFDVVAKRQPHYSASNQILQLCRRRVLAGAVAFHTVANLFYEYDREALPFLKDHLLPVCSVHGANSPTILDVLKAGFKDWEDALQAAAAQSAGAAYVVTRNVKDFKFSTVPAMTPKDFLERFHPA